MADSKNISHPLEVAPISPPLSPAPVLRRSSTPSTSSNSANSTPSPSSNRTNRHSVIGGFNSWISDLSLNINNLSPGAIFSNLNMNPFTRRNKNRGSSRTASPIPSSPLAEVPRSKSELLDKASSSLKRDASIGHDNELDQGPPAQLLNGKLVATLKAKELIELANFGVVEVESVGQGVGHEFELHRIDNPTWCDSCGDFIWQPVNLVNCVNNGTFFQTIQCSSCKYTCHSRCKKLVRIDCRGPAEIGTKLEPSEPDVHLRPAIEKTLLMSKIAAFNLRLKNKGSGLGMNVCENGTFRGFIRVNLNLTRPINVIAGTRPPSIYDIIKEDDEALNASRRTLTSFYMPRDTVKNIHITSESTSLEVIRSMLKKFKVVDNPQKFALYQSYNPQVGDTLDISSATPASAANVLKRIGDEDRPLEIALDWLDSDDKKFVLQENDTADINWNAFALPELKNFLRILEREEKEHTAQVKDRYSWYRNEVDAILAVRLIQAQGVVV